MLVTIFDGPDGYRRVRELAPDSCQVVTVKWTTSEQAAVDYIRENYAEGDALTPDAFRQEVLWRRAHPDEMK